MKHIKSINEYSRTVGFKYSKPSIKFSGVLFCIADGLSENLFSKLLNYINVEHENIEISNENEKIELEDSTVSTNLRVDFDFYVYDEKEIEKIEEDIRVGLLREFKTVVVEFLYKPYPVLK